MFDYEAITQKHGELRRRMKAADSLKEQAKTTTEQTEQMRIRAEIADALEEIKKTEKELTEMKAALLPFIERLKNWKHAEIMRGRFIYGKTIKQAGHDAGYSWSQTNRLLTEAKALINQMEERK